MATIPQLLANLRGSYWQRYPTRGETAASRKGQCRAFLREGSRALPARTLWDRASRSRLRLVFTVEWLATAYLVMVMVVR